MPMPHALTRAHQQETLDQILTSPKKYIVVESPTGSGKSAWAAWPGHNGTKVLCLVRTKSLQEQYGEGYYFNIVKGKANYACLHNGAEDASLCETEPKSKLRELCRESCPYYLARNEFLASTIGNLNYTKYFLELYENGLVKEYRPEIMFLDEAHELSNLVTDFSGIEFSWYSKKGHPNYVLKYIDKPTNILPEHYDQELCWSFGVQWLEQLKENLEADKPGRPDQNSSREEVREYKRWQELWQKVDNTLSLIQSGRELWFIRSDHEGFLAKPLTARFHFPRLFNHAPKIILMSATIGQFNTFAQELGILDYEAIQVPNIWPAALRPIEDLGGPEYTYKMDENDRRLHASLIANRIVACPKDWSGIIHVTSKAMANDLGDRLRHLLDRPIFIPFEAWGTEECLEKWLYFCSREEGALNVWWGGWEGVDLGRNQISIVARCPYPDFKSPYEKARFEFDRKASLQRITNQIVQAWGRVRRGRDEDYGPTKLVAICDAKWKRLRNYISQDILESIT